MKKHLSSLLVLFLLVSSSLVGVSNQVSVNTDTSEMLNDKDIFNVQTLQYATDWSMHRTNQTPSEETCGPFYNNIESRDTVPIPSGGLMDPPWPMISHDIKHTGRSSYSTANNSGTEAWRYAVYEEGDIYNTPLLGENNTIYLGSVHVFYLFALNTNGTEKWRCRLGYDRIWATPVISQDGTVVFPTWGGYGTVYAINPDGTVKWTFKDSESEGISSPAIAYDGTIVYGGEGYPGYPVYALYPNGTLRWRYNTGYYVIAAPAIDQEGTIYIGSGDTYFYALNLNGTLRWRFKTGDYIKGAASIATDGTIYVPSFDGYLYALYPNGTMKWKVSTGDSMNAAGVAIGKLGTIYVGTEMLRAFNPNGTLKWITDVQGDIYGSVPAISADGTIYVTAGNCLVAVNPDGTERWRKQITNDVIIRSSPSIGPNDWVYVGSGELDSDGYLHAFGFGPLTAEAYGPYTGAITEPVQFASEAFGGIPPYTSFHWDFGDGNTSEDKNPTHVYMRRDNYTAVLTVTDSTGNQSHDTASVQIGYALPKITIIKPVNALYFFNIKIIRLIIIDSSLVIGPITITVDATQVDAEIDRVDFYYDGDLQYTDRSPPYEMVWKQHFPRNQDIKVYAYDTVGQRTSKLIHIIKFL
jgi:hypothetical protein